jgi:DNA (cytosine-5)-methyltransferase 1
MKTKNITFIDLFSGIGGFRLALEKQNFKCSFSSEINSHACEMYQLNYGDNPFCDITQFDPNNLNNFDILCGGFPCQAFSIAGKKLGFEEARGTLFFDICRILSVKKPKVVFLENVKNLTLHDNGNTIKVIIQSLEDLGYFVQYKVLNAKDFGVPQNRERIFIVASLDKPFNFDKVKQHSKFVKIKDILENNTDYLKPNEYTLLTNTNKNDKSGLIFAGYLNKTIRKGVKENSLHLSRVHRQPNRIYSVLGTHPTLSSQESAGRYYILLENNQVRKLTIRECIRLMGFPEDFKLTGGKNQIYQRLGNSVCVPMVTAIADEIKNQFFTF